MTAWEPHFDFYEGDRVSFIEQIGDDKEVARTGTVVVNMTNGGHRFDRIIVVKLPEEAGEITVWYSDAFKVPILISRKV